MLALLWQLDQSQWWPPERLREHQLRQIRALVEHAVVNVPYYREALQKTGIASAAELDEASFRRWPILRKSDIRANEAALRASSYPKTHGKAFESETTGSTGTPVRIYRTEMEAHFARAIMVREHLLHGRDLARKLGTIRAGVTESTQPGWGMVNVAFDTGPGCAISLYEPIERLLDWLLRERPAYLLCTPAILRELVLMSRRRGVRPEGLIEAMTFAAMQSADLRALVGKVWGVDLTDSYSCVEAGGIAVQCPGHDHYLVHAENVYVEILGDDGMPCPPGELGRVVITPLHNFAMPLIRYELGDYAEAGGACPTGRGLPTLARIAGRVRNLLRDPAGGLRSPKIDPSLWLETGPVEQVRLVQPSLRQIDVEYVMARDLSEGEQEQLVARLQEDLGFAFDIRFVRVPALERQKGGKFEEFLSLLAEEGS